MRSKPDPVAIVQRQADGTHGVALLFTLDGAPVSLQGTVAEWRALLPKIEAACTLAERPGQLP